VTTPAPEPSAYARERLDELVSCGLSVEVLAVTEQGTVLALMDGETPVFIAHADDTPRAELSRQTFIVCERAEQSFRRFLHSQVDEDFRLQWMN
jgi:hypothetical protein